jgi:4-amino-4-deoxy-L-arabinose transferase-like glycosyltransferase
LQGTLDDGGRRPAIASADRMGPRLGLAAILALAIGLRGWAFGEHAFITPYYLAGVRSMLNSWHNFFFNAFDPAGFISLDKPPVAFWLQTASAKLFGFGPAAVLLPQLAEGIAAILLIYVLLRRRCGETAALLGALFLALTPINVAIDRSNNTESCLVLMLVAAAWALTRAIETGRLRFALLAAVLVGLGFNTKMLLAFGVLPGFAVLYLFAAPLTWRARLGHLTAAGVALAAVSLVWVLAYDLTPAQDRPFVDSTRDNSMVELAVGHNGMQRFIRPVAAGRQPGADTAQTAAPMPEVTPRGGGRDFAPAGPLRLAAPRLASQMGWLWPLVLIGGIAAWVGAQPGRPLSGERLQLALWTGWTLAYGIVLSAAGGLFHAYYLAVLAPALAGLAGIGLARLWALYRRGGRAALLLPAALLTTAVWQAYVLDEFSREHMAIGAGWLVPSFIVFAGVSATALVALPRLAASRAALVGAAVIPVLLLLPAAWSIGTTLAPGISGFPAARPPLLTEDAQTQRRRWSMVAGGIAGDARLIEFLRGHRDGEQFMLATVNARLAAPIIIATGAPVMALGGFSGGDPILDVDALARMVAAGRVRFALVGDGSPGLRRIFGEGRQAELVAWIRQFGRLVDPASWRSSEGLADTARRRGAEMINTQLYDLRPTTAEH